LSRNTYTVKKIIVSLW